VPIKLTMCASILFIHRSRHLTGFGTFRETRLPGSGGHNDDSFNDQRKKSESTSARRSTTPNRKSICAEAVLSSNLA